MQQERELYSDALTAYRHKKYRLFSKYTNQLRRYPLYPYLKYKQLIINLRNKNITEVKQFLAENDNSPISDKLRTQLLIFLAKHKQWKDYLLSYRQPQTVKFQCLYLQALYKEGFKEPALQQVSSLWMTGKSQHKTCEYIFEKFQQASRLTTDMIWQRIKLSIESGNISLVKHLAKGLPENDQPWISLWIKSHRKPEVVLKHKLLDSIHPHIHTIITHAIKRQSLKDTDKAIKLFNYLNTKTAIPYNKKIEIYKNIGLRLAQNHDETAIDWLNKIPDTETTRYITEWKIQYAIRHEQWHIVVNQIDNMIHTEQQKIRWQFWWGYAHKQLGHEIESTEILQRVANKRDYYGFLAADLTYKPYNFEDTPITINEKIIAEIEQLPGILRARELYHFNQIARARREWNDAISEFSNEYLLTAAKLAHNWKWYDRAIAAIGKTQNLNDVEIRFPLVYSDIIDSYSNKYDIDSAWTYAIIRRESIFIRDAKSDKGAIGLMQLMPGTARATARAIKTGYHSEQQLIKSALNIRLGTHYLKSLFKKHNQQTVLATAAYNAGPSNVRKWLPENEPMDAIRWIESIPFKETREYVTNVLAYNIIYHFRMGIANKTLLTQLMPPVPAKI